MGRKFRRLVTGHDDSGKSKFIIDGEATSILEIAAMGDLTVTDIWETAVSPADNTGQADAVDRPVHLEPAATGTIFRLVEFPPDAVWKTDGADGKEAFSELQAEHASSEGDDPAMHKTASVDYALVLEGEIWAVMETDERLMTAGDVLVQRGTNHGWSNRTDKNCLMMFVLCGAEAV